MPSNSTLSRAGRLPRSKWVVVIVPLATYVRVWPVASTTPKPVVCRPGSMPRMRMDFMGLFSGAEVPARRVEEDRRGEAQRVHAIEQAIGACHRDAALAPRRDAAVALEGLHHQVSHRSGGAGDEGHCEGLPGLEGRDEGQHAAGEAAGA